MRRSIICLLVVAIGLILPVAACGPTPAPPTRTPVPATATPMPPTPTATDTPTNTPAPTATDTPTNTPEPSPTDTPTNTPPPAPTEAKPVALLDSFDSNLNDWPTGDYTGELLTGYRRITDGVYRWEATAHKGVIWPANPDMEPVGDFYLTVEGKRISGPDDAAWGVVFRKDKADNYYRIKMGDDQYFKVSLRHEEEWTTLVGWTRTSTIRPGEMNRLTVIAEGSHFNFLINDQYVAETDDSRLPSGKAGLAISLDAGDEVVFEFDNFELRPLAPGVAPRRTPVPPTPTPRPGPNTALIEVVNYCGTPFFFTIAGTMYEVAGNSTEIIELPPGEYTYTLSKPGFQDINDAITVEAGRTYRRTFTCEIVD